MYRIVFHRLAAEEAKAAGVYCEAQDARIGNDFLDEIEHAITKIRESPLL